MKIIDFEYKRKFNVDIWKQDKSSSGAATREAKPSIKALRKKLVSNEMEKNYITKWPQIYFYLQVLDLCKLLVAVNGLKAIFRKHQNSINDACQRRQDSERS